jgi:hypothetical protein
MLPEFPTPPSELPTGPLGLEVAAGLFAAGLLGCHMRVRRDSGRHGIRYQQSPIRYHCARPGVFASHPPDGKPQ